MVSDYYGKRPHHPIITINYLAALMAHCKTNLIGFLDSAAFKEDETINVMWNLAYWMPACEIYKTKCNINKDKEPLAELIDKLMVASMDPA